MKARRKAKPLSEEGRRRDAARSYANTYLRRGIIKRQPCEICGDPKTLIRHEDYSAPLQIRWLCKAHHREDVNRTVDLSAPRPKHRDGELECQH